MENPSLHWLDGNELPDVFSQIGLVIRPNDIEAVTQAILKLKNSPELRNRLGDQSLEQIKNKWGQ